MFWGRPSCSSVNGLEMLSRGQKPGIWTSRPTKAAPDRDVSEALTLMLQLGEFN